MSLRRRIENSTLLAGFLASIAGAYLGFCQRTIRWNVTGADELAAQLADGPVLLLMWHERSLMGPVHWPLQAGPLSSLFAASPIGRVSGALQRRMGLQPLEMSSRVSNVANSRAILRRVRDGVSIGMTGDGPLGPAGILKDAPLDWARVTGMPVWVYAFQTSRHRRLRSWDQMVVPRPFGRGAVVFAPLAQTVTRNVDIDSLRRDLADCLNAATARADASIAHSNVGP